MKRFLCLFLAAIMLALSLAGCGTDSSKYIIKVNDHEITQEEYRYYFLNAKKKLDNGAERFWELNPGKDQILKDSVYDMLITIALAQDSGISLTDEEIASIDANIETLKAKYETEKAYLEALADNYISNAELYREICLQTTVYSKFMRSLVPTDEQLDEYIQNNNFRAKHIYCETREKADEAMQKIRDGADFEDVLAEYNEDDKMKENSDGLYFAYQEDLAAYEDPIIALEENEISDVINISESYSLGYGASILKGYYIFNRLPLDPDYIEQNRDSVFKTDYCNTQYMTKLNQFKKSAHIEFCSNYAKLGINNVK